MAEDYAHFITQALNGWRNQALERIVGMDPRTHNAMMLAIGSAIAKVMDGVDKMTNTDQRIAKGGTFVPETPDPSQVSP